MKSAVLTAAVARFTAAIENSDGEEAIVIAAHLDTATALASRLRIVSKIADDEIQLEQQERSSLTHQVRSWLTANGFAISEGNAKSAEAITDLETIVRKAET